MAGRSGPVGADAAGEGVRPAAAVVAVAMAAMAAAVVRLRRPGLPRATYALAVAALALLSLAAGGLAWRQRAAELRVLAAGGGASDRALRELLALQSSDWAFLVARDTAGPYPRERAAGHEQGLDAALADPTLDPSVRDLAPWLAAGAVREP